MTKEIVCFDLETTGLDKQKDQIIQFAAIKFNTSNWQAIDSINYYILPDEPFEIAQGAFEKNGLTKEFLQKEGVKLEDVAQEIIDFFGNCDILTYNGNHFDIPFIYIKFKDINKSIDFSKRRCYDSHIIEHDLHSTKLTEAYKRYVGEYFEDAHNAFADVNATIEVFKHQLSISNVNESLEGDERHNIISPEGFIYKDNNRLVFGTGKHLGDDVYNICREDPSYIKWLFTVCSEETKKAVVEYYKKRKEESNIN